MQERFGWGRRKSPKGTKIPKRPSAVSRSKGEQRTNRLPGGPEGSTRRSQGEPTTWKTQRTVTGAVKDYKYLDDPKVVTRSGKGETFPKEVPC